MGSLLTFVNAVSDETVKTHPDVKIGTLAYWYSRKAPATIKPRPNVQIQLCSIECCMMHPINDPQCELNVAFCNDLQAWSQVCRDINIWNYNTNFTNYLLPCPNLRVLESNIRFFVANQARGIFMQGAGNAMGAEFSDLRNYITSRLLWNPELSGPALMDEFLDLHYGPAAPPIRQFIQIVHDNAEKQGLHRNCFGQTAHFGIDKAVAQAGLSAFDEALKLADSESVRARVEKASICAYRAAIDPAWGWIEANRHLWGDDRSASPPMEAAIAQQCRPHVRRLFELCDQYGVTHWSEGIEIEKIRQWFAMGYGLAANESF